MEVPTNNASQRRAQQRFRERQKAKSTETQSEVSRLKLQVGTLQAQLAEAEHSRRLLDQGAGPSMGLSAFSAGIKVRPVQSA